MRRDELVRIASVQAIPRKVAASTLMPKSTLVKKQSFVWGKLHQIGQVSSDLEGVIVMIRQSQPGTQPLVRSYPHEICRCYAHARGDVRSEHIYLSGIAD